MVVVVVVVVAVQIIMHLKHKSRYDNFVYSGYPEHYDPDSLFAKENSGLRESRKTFRYGLLIVAQLTVRYSKQPFDILIDLPQMRRINHNRSLGIWNSKLNSLFDRLARTITFE